MGPPEQRKQRKMEASNQKGIERHDLQRSLLQGQAKHHAKQKTLREAQMGFQGQKERDTLRKTCRLWVQPNTRSRLPRTFCTHAKQHELLSHAHTQDDPKVERKNM